LKLKNKSEFRKKNKLKSEKNILLRRKQEKIESRRSRLREMIREDKEISLWLNLESSKRSKLKKLSEFLSLGDSRRLAR